MAIDLIHMLMAVTFFALWAVIGHIAMASRRSQQAERRPDLPLSGNVGQR